MRPGADLAIEQVGDVVYVARLPAGPIFVLEGAAATIWEASLRGDAESIVPRVASTVGLSAAEIGTGTEAFVEELVQAGLLAFER